MLFSALITDSELGKTLVWLMIPGSFKVAVGREAGIRIKPEEGEMWHEKAAEEM